MRGTYAALTQSKYFTPAFNSAIFDGPVRIYFAQFHESLALKIYFSLQQKFTEEFNRAKEQYRGSGKTVLVMMYPSKESFQYSFENEKAFLAKDDLQGDTVVGINGPFEDSDMNQVLDVIMNCLRESASTMKAPIHEAAL
jgi:hypothetical protein